MVDWAHEQLSMLQGQLTFLKLGSARIFIVIVISALKKTMSLTYTSN